VHTPCEEKSDDVKDSFCEELDMYLISRYRRHNIKKLLGEFNAKVGTEDIFKQTIGNDSPHEINNYNGVTVINIATSKN
jgi:hypothetical protein